MRTSSKEARPHRRVVALIAAAGKGTRLGAPVPKAFVPLRGRSLLERSIQAMITAEIVDEIIVLISPEIEDYARNLLATKGLLNTFPPVHLVHGGGERADSVWAGLQKVSDPNAVVLIHDAARALTPPGMIARVANAVLRGAPGVIPVLPVTDTIKEIASPESHEVIGTPPRALLRAVQTPQGFDLPTLRAANENYFKNPTFIATDDASLLENQGIPVITVAGDPMAFKITTPIDFRLAEAITAEAEPTIFEIPGD
ncbi:2-C-methyl-D-erythritol 4-phosphate cytidylyltransferase [Corynebacterium caspium]|uniref:2-C-methyl-D-erythritol 4-phosphate cytidylyltransferase n=1 Tax=Corynebacterium caspium TaxID=234828 RepID=UPI00037F7FBD|nr:2-C-methyl-D-erythritol 4-phosphate cytidylyltransferase [Corynebacterium caspium]